jgi:predicted small lipoprotein YifL
MRSVLLLAALIFVSLTIGCRGSKGPVYIGVEPPSESAKRYPNLAIQARELNEAFGKKDYARFVDLIHPKVIEMAGGREQMIAEMTKELKEMEAEGVVILSSTSGEPTQFIRDESGAIYAVLPTTLKIKAQSGIFQAESSMIAISSDGGANWKFIDASGKDQGELKKLIPGVADKLKLPPDKPPVKISNVN